MVLFALALGSVLLLIGTVIQMVNALQNGIRSLENSQTDLGPAMPDGPARTYYTVPRWRIRKRRALLKQLIRESGDPLSPTEQWTLQSFDRQALGWAFLVVGSLVVFIASTVEWVQTLGAVG
ncbi:hypothetical protein [Mycetocola zhujimingii]|uniref:Uncharacterized protein n=1 Tax=Mycetocola zhujimingii TaxID=2079792 RepID=A0A2U1TC28_9MICO|nr:hypothetical protein [Mycetocola zhujimingii]PWC06445.1 hypothetical protein DF223_12705 [Mycetocola zhujimingii]